MFIHFHSPPPCCSTSPPYSSLPSQVKPSPNHNAYQTHPSGNIHIHHLSTAYILIPDPNIYNIYNTTTTTRQPYSKTTTQQTNSPSYPFLSTPPSSGTIPSQTTSPSRVSSAPTLHSQTA